MADEQANNVHYLDEWRSQQRNRKLNGPKPSWMRRQRPWHQRSHAGANRRGTGGQLGSGTPPGYYANSGWQRNVADRRSGLSRPGVDPQHSGGTTLRRRGHAPGVSRRSADGSPLRSVSSAPRNKSFSRRLITFCVWVSSIIIFISGLLLWGGLPPRQLPTEPLPPVLRLWAALDDAHASALLPLLDAFEQQHGVQIELHNNLPPSYDLVRTLMSGHGPDVLFTDAEMSSRLFALEALHPLWESTTATDGSGSDPETSSNGPLMERRDSGATTTGPDTEYVLQLAEESLWVRSLRAVIPLHARDVAMARLFVDYIADVVDGSVGQ